MGRSPAANERLREPHDWATAASVEAKRSSGRGPVMWGKQRGLEGRKASFQDEARSPVQAAAWRGRGSAPVGEPLSFRTQARAGTDQAAEKLSGGEARAPERLRAGKGLTKDDCPRGPRVPVTACGGAGRRWTPGDSPGDMRKLLARPRSGPQRGCRRQRGRPQDGSGRRWSPTQVGREG